MQVVFCLSFSAYIRFFDEVLIETNVNMRKELIFSDFIKVKTPLGHAIFLCTSSPSKPKYIHIHVCDLKMILDVFFLVLFFCHLMDFDISDK